MKGAPVGGDINAAGNLVNQLVISAGTRDGDILGDALDNKEKTFGLGILKSRFLMYLPIIL